MAQNQQDIIFANGFTFKKNEKAPDFVVGRMAIKVSDAVEFLGVHEKNGWVNLDIKMSKMGAYYVALDQFEPQGQKNPTPPARPRHQPEPEEETAQQSDNEEDDGLPF